MKLKYAFVGLLALVLLSLLFVAHRESKLVNQLEATLKKSSTPEQFDNHGLADFSQSLQCLSPAALLFFESKYHQPLSAELYVRLLSESINTYPHHMVDATNLGHEIRISLLYNLKNPITITFVMKTENGLCRIHRIEQLCLLFQAMNTDIEYANSRGL